MTDPIATMQDVAASVEEAASIRQMELVQAQKDAKIEPATLYVVLGWRGKWSAVPAYNSYSRRAIHGNLPNAEKSRDRAVENHWRHVTICRVELQ